MRRFALLVAGLALLAGVAATVSGGATQAEARWVITDLGALGGARSGDYLSGGPAAINEQGQIVGSSYTKSGTPHAFIWNHGKMRDLGTLGGRESRALAITEVGQVIGWSDTQRKNVRHAFLWQDGRMIDLGTLGGTVSEARAINELGQIVGASRTGSGADSGIYGPEPVEHAFLWENGRMRDLGTLGGRRSAAADINAKGQVVGWSTVKRRYRNGEAMRHAFLWQDGKMRDLGVLPGGKESQAIAINDAGQIVAYSYYTAFDLETTPGHNMDFATAFLWQSGRKTPIGRRGSFPRGMNAEGKVFGEIYAGGKQWMDYAGTGSWAQPFSWADSKQRLLRNFGGWTQAINERGQIVGLQSNDGMRACLWQSEGALVFLPVRRGDYDSKAVAINERDQIVGISGGQSVLWTLKP